MAEMQKGKMVVWGGLTNSSEKQKLEAKEKRKDIPFECRVLKNSKEREESLSQWSIKEIEEKNRMVKTRDFFKKIRDTKGTFHAKMGTIKDRNGMDQDKQKI